MATWKESPNWTPFDDINGGQQFSNMLSPEDLNKLAENIAYLYENQGENEYVGEYAGGNYRAGAIVKYSDGNIYMCIKDTDDEQEPTNATYWQMLNTASSGETIPEFTEVEGFDVFLDEADEGTLTVAYSTPQDVKLPAPSGISQAVRLASIDDANFIANNIKKGVSIFGLTGAYEGETVAEWDGSGVVITPIESGVTLISFTIDGEEYQAEDGMNWYQWVQSDYAPDSYSCSSEDSQVNPSGDTYIVDRDNEEVLGRELIISGDSYSIKEFSTDTSLISFTIDGTSYQAEQGMTWEQWLSSEYNTGSYYTTGSWIRKSNSNIVGLSVGNPVFAWNNISANTAYAIITTSGLGPEPS